LHSWQQGPRQAELAEVCHEHNELRLAVLRRQRAESELRELYRERSIQRARATERDGQPLN
jgi:hypothetical protein